MNTSQTRLNPIGYLVGGIGPLAMAFLVVPGMLVVPTLVARIGLAAMLLLGAGTLWWAIRRFTGLSERVVAVVSVVLGWYMLLALINGVMMFARL